MKIKRKRKDPVFDFVVYGILTLLGIITLIPFMQVVTISLSPQDVLAKYGMHIFPRKITLQGYKNVLQYGLIWTSYLNTIIRTTSGTFLSVLLLILGAYPLSKKNLPHKKFWTIFVVFTMYFSGGLIPRYLLINNVLHLSNTIWALILPTAVSGFNLIIVRNFFMAIPDSLEEAAKIDGANDFLILFRIYVPLSLPILATVALWQGVHHWNQWFDCMLYIKEESKYVLQLVLRQILLEGTSVEQEIMSGSQEYVNSDTMKMATLIVSIIPVLCIYPFLQKYFVQGIKMGGIKG